MTCVEGRLANMAVGCCTLDCVLLNVTAAVFVEGGSIRLVMEGDADARLMCGDGRLI